MAIPSLPNELVLEIFSYFPIKSLIAARGVNREWRGLVPQAPLRPARRALLALYDDVIKCRYFLATRSNIVRNLTQPFNREKYVADLEAQINSRDLADELRTWLLEWPEKAAFGWMWPGLKDVGFIDEDLPNRHYGESELPAQSPHLIPVNILGTNNANGDEYLADPPHVKGKALLLWHEGCAHYVWIVLQSEDDTLVGTVHPGEGYWSDTYFWPSWVAWLRDMPEFEKEAYHSCTSTWTGLGRAQVGSVDQELRASRDGC